MQRDSIYKKEEFFRRILDERMAGLPSIGFMNADADSLGSDVTLDEIYHDPMIRGASHIVIYNKKNCCDASLKTLLPP